jgi:hypothetical protein
VVRLTCGKIVREIHPLGFQLLNLFLCRKF